MRAPESDVSSELEGDFSDLIRETDRGKLDAFDELAQEKGHGRHGDLFGDADTICDAVTLIMLFIAEARTLFAHQGEGDELAEALDAALGEAFGLAVLMGMNP